MYKRRKPEDAAQAHHTTAAIQNACRRRNTGTSHSRGTLAAMPVCPKKIRGREEIKNKSKPIRRIDNQLFLMGEK